MCSCSVDYICGRIYVSIDRADCSNKEVEGDRLTDMQCVEIGCYRHLFFTLVDLIKTLNMKKKKICLKYNIGTTASV